MDTKIPKENAVLGIAARTWASVERPGKTQSEILEGRLRQDHVHVPISIPPKHAVSRRGYYVSTVGIDEVVIPEYIRHQEDEDRRVDQLSLWNE
jgi:REP element-mobilizing transposase RayT